MQVYSSKVLQSVHGDSSVRRELINMAGVADMMDERLFYKMLQISITKATQKQAEFLGHYNLDHIRVSQKRVFYHSTYVHTD